MKGDSTELSRQITSVMIKLVFLTVTGLSLFLSPELSWNSVLFSLLKGGVAAVVGLFFFLMISDSLVKAIMESFVDTRETRKEGGLVFHFIPPAENEIPSIPDERENKKKSKSNRK